MATAAQVLANRWNARKSTGPRTAEGKAQVAQNAVKHGLLAREVVIQGEDPGQFEFYRDQMLGDLAPAGPVEATLADRVVSLSWRLQRAERLQNAALAVLCQENAGSRPGGPGAEDDPLALGRVVVKDFGYGTSALDRLLLYERRIEHSLYRTMGELQKLRLMRELESPAAGAVPERGSAVCSVPVRALDCDVVLGVGLAPAEAGRPEEPVGQVPQRSLPREVGRGRPTHEEGLQTLRTALGNSETPDGVTTNSPAGAAGPSEMPPDPSIPRLQDFNAISAPPAATGQSCETNPIWGDAGEGQMVRGTGAQRGLPQGERGKTNPISVASS